MQSKWGKKLNEIKTMIQTKRMTKQNQGNFSTFKLHTHTHNTYLSEAIGEHLQHGFNSFSIIDYSTVTSTRYCFILFLHKHYSSIYLIYVYILNKITYESTFNNFISVFPVYFHFHFKK